MFDLLQIGDRASDADGASLVPKEFPLFFDGSERMQSRYAIFLLNKVSATAYPAAPKIMTFSPEIQHGLCFLHHPSAKEGSPWKCETSFLISPSLDSQEAIQFLEFAHCGLQFCDGQRSV